MSKKNIADELLTRISCLDALAGSKGELSAKGLNMTNDANDQSIIECLTAIVDAKSKLSYHPDAKVVITSVYDALLPFLGRIKIKELTKPSLEASHNEETFEELYGELNSLIGLDTVKSIVRDLMAYHRVQKMRAQADLKIPDRTLHLAFMGNPGTGKTTVARIIGKMYKQLGLLSKGHFIEVSRTDLIAGYQGQTALKVKQVIENAKGGVLFIDEAYSLTENDHSDSYGRECLTELTKALEDYRNDLVVIVAGYTDLMKAFFDSNPGLKSRFNTFIEFSDYKSTELVEIFKRMCVRDDYDLPDELVEKITNIIELEIDDKTTNFANGRYVRNLYEEIIMNHARRINSKDNITKKDLQRIAVEDLTVFKDKDKKV